MTSAFDIRIFRSGRSDYYGDEVMDAPAAYPDDELAAIAADGFNAIWLRAILRDLVPTALFREYVTNSEARLKTLIELIQAARRHGLDVWLYLNEPMSLPADSAFWPSNPACRGMPGSSGMDGWAETYAMCSSSPQVRAFLREATCELFRRAEGLGGIFLITAAEHHTHCYSHLSTRGSGTEHEPRGRQQCPRCAARSPADVIGALVSDITDGATTACRSARVAVWSWRWSLFYDDPHEPIIDRLPSNVLLMSNFEDGAAIRRGSRDVVCAEYSLGVVGPSPLFQRQAELAARRGIRTLAKLQVGTTHELATTPNLPAIPSLYRKFRWMRDHHLEGYLAAWNFGCVRTLNTWATGRLSACESLPPEEACLHMLSREYFGPNADHTAVVTAWYGFLDALQHHPMSLPFLYFSPFNYTLAYPWPDGAGTRPMSRSWTTDPWGDDLLRCARPYTMDELITLLAAAGEIWGEASELYRRGLTECDTHRDRVEAELAAVEYTGLCFASIHNLFRWYRGVLAGRPDAALIDAELACCRRARDLLVQRPELGFHQECQHRQCNPERIDAKMRTLATLAATVAS